MLLSVKKRQEYLKALGFYKGEIDGKNGPLTKEAVYQLQKKYFSNTRDVDKIYGKNTDILLRSAYNCKDAKYFKLTEFKCGCKTKYCTGYPAVLSKELVDNLDKLRIHYGNSINVTSGLRCTKFNKEVGGVSNSSHLQGKASDIYITKQSATKTGRIAIVDYWDTLPNAKYAYCNGYMKYVGKKAFSYTSSGMGNASHVNVK